MHPSNKVFLGVVGTALVAALTLWEGNKQPYRDVTGTWTVCQGITENVIPDKYYTPKECDQLLLKHAAKHGKDALSCINVPISRHEYEAYTMFTYNVGAYTFCNSGVLKELNKGNHKVACERLATHPNGKPAWSYSKGKYFQGLQNRRQFERDMCLRGVK